MRQHGKGTEDIKKALAAMQNPMISGMLNRVSPNLVQQLQQAGLKHARRQHASAFFSSPTAEY